MDAVALLSDEEIDAGLGSLPGWERRGNEITKEYELPTFPAAIAFVNQVAERAEAADHHPDLDIRWRRVRATLSTHSEGGVTGRDLALAAELESLTG